MIFRNVVYPLLDNEADYSKSCSLLLWKWKGGYTCRSRRVLLTANGSRMYLSSLADIPGREISIFAPVGNSNYTQTWTLSCAFLVWASRASDLLFFAWNRRKQIFTIRPMDRAAIPLYLFFILTEIEMYASIYIFQSWQIFYIHT